MEGMLEGMTAKLLTIAEASEKTGRSFSTIRRLIRTITDESSHPDRAGIEPTLQEVVAHKKKGENFTWKVREDVLLKHFAAAPKLEKKSSAEPTGDILSILRDELFLKNQQIEKQWEVIHALNDRLREGNILMGSLQQRLALPMADSPASSKKHSEAQTSSVEAAPKASVGSSGAGKKDIAKKSSKKGFFGWMHR
jgi:hypothetical protein